MLRASSMKRKGVENLDPQPSDNARETESVCIERLMEQDFG